MWAAAVWAGLVGEAAAQDDGGFGAARLLSGSPEFSEDCFADGNNCEADFIRFLSESMLEQGFSMQSHSLSLSPLVHRAEPRSGGVVVGGSLSTFPFGAPPENLSGKEENTSFSPVFPRLHGGWMGAEEGRQVAVGASFLPPIPVQGASALALGLEGGVRFSGAGKPGWGVEGDLSYVRARAPIVATEEQFEGRDDFDNPDNLDPETYEARCGGEGGCIDTYTLANVGLRAGYGWVAADGALAPYVKGGLALVNERLYVQYDDTTWGILGLQPSVHAGAGWRPAGGLLLALGASAALKQGNQSESGRVGAFYKLEGAAAWRF